nr:unnamed protein product [Digitaria exilis]
MGRIVPADMGPSRGRYGPYLPDFHMGLFGYCLPQALTGQAAPSDLMPPKSNACCLD